MLIPNMRQELGEKRWNGKVYKYLTETIIILAVLLALFLLWLFTTLTNKKKTPEDPRTEG